MMFRNRGEDEGDLCILDREARVLTMREARQLSERWSHRLSRRSFSDSAQLIREDRDSR
jgi:hypothetical protein